MSFQPSLSQSEVNEIINTYSDLLVQESWWFRNEDYKIKKGRKMFEAIKIACIKALAFDECGHSDIFHDIKITSFPHLICLSLNANKIVSIEQLQLMSLPFLRELGLRKNYLTSLRSLHKCGLNELNLTLLSTLLMRNNLITFDWSIVKWQIKNIEVVDFHLNKNINPRMLSVQAKIVCLGNLSIYEVKQKSTIQNEIPQPSKHHLAMLNN